MAGIKDIVETRYNAVHKPVGFIENVNGRGTSFNVYRRREGVFHKSNGEEIIREYEFYKAAYKIATARKILAAL